MPEDLDTKIKLELYRLVIKRYKDLISEHESRSISEIRQKVSPYTDFIKHKRDEILASIVPYVYKRHFFDAAQTAISYVRTIKVCEFSFNFWMEFHEMDELRIATSMDKAILLASLLRALESEDVVVAVTANGKIYVKFIWDDKPHIFMPESGSLLMGDDAMKLFENNPISYSFNDLVYENYEDQ